MRFRHRLLRRWQFSVTVLAPAIASLALTAVAVVSFVVWSTNGIDERSVDRQIRLAAVAMERQIAQVPYAQESVAIWDDAIVNTRQRFNKSWLDNNLGTWMNEYYGFDAIAVLDDRNEPIYTAVGSDSPSAAKKAMTLFMVRP